jgi:hypothetical protein
MILLTLLLGNYVEAKEAAKLRAARSPYGDNLQA